VEMEETVVGVGGGDGECCLLLNTFIVHTDVSDRWQWLPDIGGGYTVSNAYQILTFQATPIITVSDELVWHKYVL
jgi:hypothetical protein